MKKIVGLMEFLIVDHLEIVLEIDTNIYRNIR